MVPLADAATHDVRRPQAADYIHLWHHQQQQNQQQQLQVVGQQIYDNDALRKKRQLFNARTNREPGVVALTFSLIGGVSIPYIKYIHNLVVVILREKKYQKNPRQPYI